jgi:hypothetical protein
MAGEYCPQCGTARVGALRFCRSCAFDYDTLPQVEIRSPAVAAPLVAAPDGPPSASTAPVALPSSTSSRKGWIVLGAVIFAAIVAAAGFVSLSNSGTLSPHHDIAGTFDLKTTDSAPASCEGSGGYADIRLGTNVTLRDGDGKLLGTTSLGTGTGSGTTCSFTFNFRSIGEVPFYTVEVGRRGALSYSLADMQSFGWKLGMTLGS